MMDIALAIYTVLCAALCAEAYFLGARRQLGVCLRKRWETWRSDEEWRRSCDISGMKWGTGREVRDGRRARRTTR